MANKRHTAQAEVKGFTLTEVLITIVIVGILSAVALPNYFRQVQRTRQSEAASTLSQLSTIVAAYEDEFSSPPTTWEDLSDITAIMTDTGPVAAGDGDLTAAITLPGGHYQVSRNAPTTGSYYIFKASPLPVQASTQDYNVMACVDLATGASDVKVGTRDDSADADAQIEAADLTCQ